MERSRRIYPTQKELQDKFVYCASGNLIWHKNQQAKGNLRPGKIAGTNGQRYRYVMVDGVNYLAHVLIFIYHHGYRPKLVDHINRKTFDNHIENLRVASHSLNGYNRKKQKNISGARGVSIDKKAITSPYRAYISIKGKRLHLGVFNTLADAINARKEAEQKYYEGVII